MNFQRCQSSVTNYVYVLGQYNTAPDFKNVVTQRLNVSPSYLSALFKRETGQTLTQFVNQSRIRYGLFLLNSSHMQIQTVAQHCGIPNLNYFTRLFKKQVGMTPSEYRNRIRS